MPTDWIHSRDSAFQSQADEIVAIIASCGADCGLSEEELLPLQQCKQEFEQALAEQVQKADAYHAMVATKQAKREELERALRAIVRRINNHPGMTDELRQRIGVASPTRATARNAPNRATPHMNKHGQARPTHE